MAIEFDWGIFGQSIQDAARMAAGGLIQRAEEKRTEKRQLRWHEVEAAQRKLEREREQQMQKENREQMKVINMELADYGEQLKKKTYVWQQFRDARTKAILGDPDMEQQFMGAVQSSDAMGLLRFQGQMNLINKLRGGATQDDLSEEELAGLQSLPPVASAGASDLLLRNTKAKQDLELDAARIYQLKSQGDYMTAMSKVQMGKVVGLPELRKKTEERAAIQNRINDILGDPKYLEISQRIQAGDERIDPNVVAWFSQKQEEILTHKTSLGIIDAEINAIFPGVVGGEKRRPEPTPEPKRKVGTGEKIGRKISKVTGKIVEPVIMGAMDIARERIKEGKEEIKSIQARLSIKKLLKKAGLPAKTPVYTNIASLRKAGKLKVDMVVYHNRKLYRVISGKGQKWDLEEL